MLCIDNIPFGVLVRNAGRKLHELILAVPSPSPDPLAVKLRHLDSFTEGHAFLRSAKHRAVRLIGIHPVIGKDVAKLAEAVITEGGADGIYFSFQNIQDAELSKDEYLKYIAPSELAVLDAANRAGDYNILHICGYEGAVNDLTVYVDYPAKAVNYAAVVEGVPLKQAKEIFGGRTILGGFGNTKNDLLYKGAEASIKAETKRLLDDAGTVGIILGSDCTIPSDTPFAHLEWVREAAKEYAGIETGPRIRIQ